MTVDAATTVAAAASATELVNQLVALTKPHEPSPYITAIIGLVGVLVGAVIQIIGNEIAALRVRRVESQKTKDAATRSALHLAKHFEAYALKMNKAAASWSSVVWDTPYYPRSPSGDIPMYMEPLDEWPSSIQWPDLSTQTVVEAENFRDMTINRYANFVRHESFNEPERNHRDSATEAAVFCLKAWDFAQSLRQAHAICPVSEMQYEWVLAASRIRIRDQKQYEAAMEASLDELDNL